MGPSRFSPDFARELEVSSERELDSIRRYERLVSVVPKLRLNLIIPTVVAACLLLGLAMSQQDLDGLDEEHKVIRVMRWHGHFCPVKIASIMTDGRMRGVCADGKFYYQRDPSDDESLLCSLGADVLCWNELSSFSGL